MRCYLTALIVVAAVLSPAATSASAAKPPLAGLSANMAVTNTTSTCIGTLTVAWNVQGKGITGLSWSADASSTGTLGLSTSGVQFSKPQKSGSIPVSFALTAGTGEADVTASGSGIIVQTTSNTVTCVPALPDLTITNISQMAPAGYPSPWSYTVTVKNIGSATADVTNSVVQGYYTSSTDTTVFPPPGGTSSTPGGDAACGTIMQPFATSLAPGASVDVFVGCGGAGPTASTDTNLMVGVDVNNVVTESNENNDVAVATLN